MSNFFKNVFAFSVLALIVLASCSKEEGEGGTSSITGKIYVKDYNSEYTAIHHEYYAPDEYVFIMYGDHTYYDDKTSTNYDGTFHFANLRKGKYTIYVYSDDTTYYTNWSPNNHEVYAITQEIEITKNNQHISLDEIVIAK